MNKPIYSFKNLKFSKNNKLFLDIRKFDIHRGSCYMFTGDMGSGKSRQTLYFSDLSHEYVHINSAYTT